jgi:hypothetical protein
MKDDKNLNSENPANIANEKLEDIMNRCKLENKALKKILRGMEEPLNKELNSGDENKLQKNSPARKKKKL